MSDHHHPIEADGYCPTCQTVGCLQRGSSVRPPSSSRLDRDQLNRIETKLNRLLRLNGIDPDTTTSNEGASDAGQ